MVIISISPEENSSINKMNAVYEYAYYIILIYDIFFILINQPGATPQFALVLSPECPGCASVVCVTSVSEGEHTILSTGWSLLHIAPATMM